MKEIEWQSEKENMLQQIGWLKNEIEKLKASVIIPVGAIQAFALEKAPDGWLICNGKELLIEPFQNLFEAIGNTFGGDGKTTFRLPDLQGRFVRGWDIGGNIDPERKLGDYQKDALQGHGHEINLNSIKCKSSGKHSHLVKERGSDMREANLGYSTTRKYEIFQYDGNGSNYESSSSGDHTHSLELNENKPFINDVVTSKYGIIKCDTETRPINVALLYCIKYQ